MKAKVLKIKAVTEKGETAEYALVDETRLKDAEEGGSKSELKVTESGSKPDMPSGSISDEGGSKSDMGGSKPDNNTILIDNPLKAPRLKDPSYVEPGLPNPTNSPETDKLKGVKDVHPFRTIQASGTHTPNPMSSKGTLIRRSQQSL